LPVWWRSDALSPQSESRRRWRRSLLTPAPAAAIFAGKAIAAALLLCACEVVLLPALALFFGTPLNLELVVAVLLATVGMAALGCLFAAMVARLRVREVLLPLLTLPLWIPFVIAGGQAVQVAMGASGSYNQAVALLVDLRHTFRRAHIACREVCAR